MTRRARRKREREGPKRERSYTVCRTTNKRGYEDRLTALTWASRTAMSGGVSRPYECDSCGKWHLTSWPTPNTPSARV